MDGTEPSVLCIYNLKCWLPPEQSTIWQDRFGFSSRILQLPVHVSVPAAIQAPELPDLNRRHPYPYHNLLQTEEGFPDVACHSFTLIEVWHKGVPPGELPRHTLSSAGRCRGCLRKMFTVPSRRYESEDLQPVCRQPTTKLPGTRVRLWYRVRLR